MTDLIISRQLKQKLVVVVKNINHTNSVSQKLQYKMYKNKINTNTKPHQHRLNLHGDSPTQDLEHKRKHKHCLEARQYQQKWIDT